MMSLLLPFLRLFRHKPTLEADIIIASLSLMGCNENWLIGSEASFRSHLAFVRKSSFSFYLDWMDSLLKIEKNFCRKKALFSDPSVLEDLTTKVIEHLKKLLE